MTAASGAYPLRVPCPNPACRSHGAYLRTRGGAPSDYECWVCKTVVPLATKPEGGAR